VITQGKSKQFMRITVDLEQRDVALLDELEAHSGMPSKREIFTSGLRLLSSLFRARLSGMRPQIIDPATKKTLDFDWQSLPQIPGRPAPRVLDGSRLQEATVRTLLSHARDIRDLDLIRVSATIANASWDPSGRGTIEASVVVELIVIAQNQADGPLLKVTKDVVTQLTTVYKSFTEILDGKLGGYSPSFDTTLIEQRFLSDQYRRAFTERFPDHIFMG
jgi:hypothetical protein